MGEQGDVCMTEDEARESVGIIGVALLALVLWLILG